MTILKSALLSLSVLALATPVMADAPKAEVAAPKAGVAVKASKDTVENGTYFPFSRPLFIYVSENSLKRPEVKQFTEFYLKNASTFVPEVKYVSLPAKAYELAQQRLGKNQLGTVFQGHAEVGLKIEEILKKETKL